MVESVSLSMLRAKIRDNTLVDEATLAKNLLQAADFGVTQRRNAQDAARAFVASARANAERSGLIDKFLQEYGLSTAEGVTLMRLAEALLRTPDVATADALIEDKIEAGDWHSHKGKSPFPLVNFSTRALMFTAAWLDDVEANDPGRKMVAATKSLLDRIGEPVIRASVGQAMRIMGEHFVLGQSIDEATRRGETFKKLGYRFSYDMLGEAALTKPDADKYFTEYAQAIAAIAKNATHDDPIENPGISVKLSALHPRYEFGKKDRVLEELGGSLRSLALAAKSANIGFNIDAEEADRLDISLDLIEQIMRDPAFDGWSGFGVVIQAYQRRATFVIDWLADLAREMGRRVMVRLVKGAYWDGEIKRAQVMGLETYPVFTRKLITDVSFVACARKLLDADDVFYPQFATHNALTASMVMEMAGSEKQYEFQRLHGMGEALHNSLIDKGAKSRIYAPVGGHRELLPYLVRRLLENGANSSFVNQLIDPDLSIDDVIADPIDEALALEILPNTSIRMPRDLFNGSRLSSIGWDETDPATAERLSSVVSRPLRPLKQEIANQLSGPEAKTFNPAQSSAAIGKITTASQEDVAAACERAQHAAPAWREAKNKKEIFLRAADLLEERGEDFMALCVQEAGKSIPDAIAEVREAVDFLRYYANQAEKLSGDPLGVVACISPWNFPLAIFLGQVSAALLADNAVIAKPAEQTPLIAQLAVALLHEAGVPHDALILLPGDGPIVGAPLVENPAISGVVFTGSTATAHSINRALARANKHDARLIAETGGINAMIIDSTALLEQAVKDVVDSAFQSAGQRCSACRLVCIQEDVADRFNEMLAGAIAELQVGNPARLTTDVGPVIDNDALVTINAHVALMEKSSKLIARAADIDDDVNGTFVRPVAFELENLSDLKTEIFGPVLHVVRFKSNALEALVDQINALGYGLTMGIHTRIDETMENIAGRAKIGNIYVNRNQIGAVVGVQPFGGEGLSGTGPKAGGPHYLQALQQSASLSGTNAFTVSNDECLPEIESIISTLEQQYHNWNTDKTKSAIFRKARQSLENNNATAILENAADLYDTQFLNAAELPGPTGESNRLRLRGRGIVLCVGDASTIARQLPSALAAGNLILALILDGPQNSDTNNQNLEKSDIEKVANALREAGAPVVACLASSSQEISASLLAHPELAAVVADADQNSRAAIKTTLADRDGAIIPLLNSGDHPHRFASERTLTINTTAAGGDVRLLSLPE